MRVLCVAAATIRGWGLVSSSLSHLQDFVVAAVATVCQEPHFQRGEGKEVVAFLFDPQKFFAFESIAAHDLINSIPGIYGWI